MVRDALEQGTKNGSKRGDDSTIILLLRELGYRLATSLEGTSQVSGTKDTYQYVILSVRDALNQRPRKGHKRVEISPNCLLKVLVPTCDECGKQQKVVGDCLATSIDLIAGGGGRGSSTRAAQKGATSAQETEVARKQRSQRPGGPGNASLWARLNIKQWAHRDIQ